MLAMSVAGLDPPRGLLFSLVLRAEQVLWAAVGFLAVRRSCCGARREAPPLATAAPDGRAWRPQAAPEPSCRWTEEGRAEPERVLPPHPRDARRRASSC